MKTFLNILPEKQKKRIQQKRVFRFFLKEKFVFFVIIFFLLLGLFLIFHTLQGERETLESDVQHSEKFTQFQEIEKYEKGIREISREISFLNKALLYQPKWSEVLFSITEEVEGKMQIHTIELGKEGNEITGITLNREVLLAFEKRLEESACFTEVSIPLSDLAQRENITFHIRFSVEESCLQ